MQKISLAIAEDNPLALKSILKKLEGFGGAELSFVAINGAELLTKYAENPTDVVLMDIEMPIMDGIKATAELMAKYKEVKILMLTTFDDDEKIFNAILAGALGYLLKNEDDFTIQKAIRDVYEGKAAMSASIALKALNYIKKTSLNLSSCTAPEDILSKREIEILVELKNGLGYKQIAGILFISEGTVRKHIENIYRKLQVNNKVSAVNVGIENKWF
jgi:DNA-binding NarL/FixJ family response regulator